MKDTKRLNRWVWGLNVLLGAGIVVFSFKVLLRAPDSALLKDVRPPESGPTIAVKSQDEGDGALKSLRNPLRKFPEGEPKDPERPFTATLKGTLPSNREPKGGVAFIKSPAQNVELVAYIDEEILQDGETFEEYRGWTLSSLSRDRATFVNGKGLKVDVTLDQSRKGKASGLGGGQMRGPLGDGRGRIDKAYTSESYKSRLLAASEAQQVWGLDPNEINWVAENMEQILDRDLLLAPYAGGGLRLEGVAAGSIGAARGLVHGDVLRELNGQPLNTLTDVRTLMTHPAIKTGTGMRLTLERAGKSMVIEYRPLPR